MGKSSSAPDPYATSAAQTQSNQQTANYNAELNRVDQYTPYGSSTYTQTGTGASGAPTYRQDITLTPLAQQQLDNELRQNADLSTLGYKLYDAASQNLANPVTADGLPALSGGPASTGVQTSLGQTGDIQSSVGSGPGLFTGIQSAGNVQRGIGNTGSVTSRYGSGGQIQSGLNYSGLTSLPDANSFNDAATAASDAAYKSAAARLDPQYSNYQSDLDAKLANQGVVQGSEAWQRAQDELGRQRTDAYGQAQNAAYQQGLAAQQQGYSQALSTREQGANEITTAGNFANAAQAQGNSQNAAAAAFANSAQAQNTDQALARANLANSAQQQQFNQNQAQAQFSNDAQQQMYNNLLSSGAFTNAAQAQQFSQALQSGQFSNEAEAQAYAQALQSAQQNNAARAQGLQEQSTLATLPLNQLQALRSGTQVTNPTFTSVPQSTAANTDVSGNIYKSYQLDTANQNSFMNGLFGLGSAALSNAAIFSDRRLKRDIRRIGATPGLGLPLYEFSYIWDRAKRFVGVMADEAVRVIPAAVHRTASGYLAVDYGMVR